MSLNLYEKNTIGDGVPLYLPSTHEQISVSWAGGLLYDEGMPSVKLIIKASHETVTDLYVKFPGLRVSAGQSALVQ